jgi:anti-sigma-K factor RskA
VRATSKTLRDVGGDVVWSDEKQAGYMRLRGLPVNDKSKETYQLWIFDKTQDKATPIDGGTFDVDKEGEVVIPIDAKLKALGPELFAITIEKPGGVVVSKREKIAALAKVEAPAKTNT